MSDGPRNWYYPDGVHDPKAHKQACQRFRIEDDVVIAHMCGGYLYDPIEPCTCGADNSAPRERWPKTS